MWVGDGITGGGDRQRHPPAGEIGGIEIAQHEVGVGRGRQRAALHVARGAGIGTGAVRAHPQQTARIDPADRAAARAYGVDVEHRQRDLVPRDLAVVDEDRRIDRNGRLEAGAAHVGGDRLVLAQRPRVEEARARTAGGPRQQRQRRLAARDFRRHHPAVALHDQQQAAKVDRPKAAHEPLHVAVELRPDVRIERRRRQPLVEPDRRQQRGRHGEERVGHRFAHQHRGRFLMRRVGERVHEADRDRLHTLLLEVAGARGGRRPATAPRARGQRGRDALSRRSADGAAPAA